MAKATAESISRETAFINALEVLGYKMENRIDMLETFEAVTADKDVMNAVWDKYHEGGTSKPVGDGYKHLWVQSCFRKVMSQPAFRGVKELFEIALANPKMTVEEIHAAHFEKYPPASTKNESPAQPVKAQEAKPTPAPAKPAVAKPAAKPAKTAQPAAPPVQQPTSRGAVKKKAPEPAPTEGDDTMASKKKTTSKKTATKKAPAKKREKGEETPVVAGVLKMLGRAKGATMQELVEGNPEAKPRYLAALIHRILKEKGYKISKERDGKTVHYFVK